MKREVLHEWTEEEPWEIWRDDLGIHYKYRCVKCERHTTTIRKELFDRKLCYKCAENAEGKS
ncbi:hypothetical protein DRP04_01825 [Archaeoglobales archaeon]|nr:MAG: hypothetical protein DRP04_01825 [Archaeoglobales archaeon]